MKPSRLLLLHYLSNQEAQSFNFKLTHLHILQSGSNRRPYGFMSLRLVFLRQPTSNRTRKPSIASSAIKRFQFPCFFTPSWASAANRRMQLAAHSSDRTSLTVTAGPRNGGHCLPAGRPSQRGLPQKDDLVNSRQEEGEAVTSSEYQGRRFPKPESPHIYPSMRTWPTRHEPTETTVQENPVKTRAIQSDHGCEILPRVSPEHESPEEVLASQPFAPRPVRRCDVRCCDPYRCHLPADHEGGHDCRGCTALEPTGLLSAVTTPAEPVITNVLLSGSPSQGGHPEKDDPPVITVALPSVRPSQGDLPEKDDQGWSTPIGKKAMTVTPEEGYPSETMDIIRDALRDSRSWLNSNPSTPECTGDERPGLTPLLQEEQGFPELNGSFSGGSTWKEHIHPEWVRVKTIVDSGAARSVAPPSMAPGVRIEESDMSRRGQSFIGANGEILQTRGNKPCASPPRKVRRE